MFKPLELFVGLRYIRAKRRNQFISFISITSIMGIILGVTALITVLSVMNGFVTELRERILSMTSHVVVNGFDGELQDWQSVAAQIQKHQPEVIGLAPFIQGEGMLTAGQQVKGVMVRGVYPEEEIKVSDVADKMIEGQFNDLKAGNYNIILGKGLARYLGVMIGDKVTLVTPKALSTPAGILPRLKRFTVSGVFEVGQNEYDTALAFVHLKDAAKLYRMGENVSGIRLKLDDLFAATQVSNQLSIFLRGSYWVTDWSRQHANFFRAVHLEKRMMFLILMIIVIVAAFNILSALVMVVRDKQSDIAILRTLGTSPRSIMMIFIVQGTVIGIAGTLLGMAGGVSLALNVAAVVSFIEQLFSVQFMPADVYFISDFPSELHWDDVLQVCAFAFLISVVATLYPAWNASRTQPAEALRYE
ncbi:MAG: lipoprotein-releasing ABC transporter permease subunit [Gammaproteobacteria bacterium]|jgi:lipoprotein-releasing system permease protein|nr:lipoprotein-releasing ABC transporter permease subunit [Gammaproteobacteria bacterium]